MMAGFLWGKKPILNKKSTTKNSKPNQNINRTYCIFAQWMQQFCPNFCKWFRCDTQKTINESKQDTI